MVADVENLPFADGEFDCVIAAWMLYHVPDLDRGLAELARVIRPGGLLVAITNGNQHLIELWNLVSRDPVRLTFNRANGADLLLRHFYDVEQHDLTARAVFEGRDDAVRYLASIEDGHELVEALPEFGGPVRGARGANRVHRTPAEAQPPSVARRRRRRRPLHWVPNGPYVTRLRASSYNATA